MMYKSLLYFRPSVRYRAKPWFTIHGGIRFFKTFLDDEDDLFRDPFDSDEHILRLRLFYTIE